MSYYIGSAFSSTGSSDFTCIFYDTTGYTADSSGFTGLDWTVASGFMYVGDDKGAIGWGKTTDSTTDVYTKLTVGATGFKNGIYADANGLYAVVDGTAIPYDNWGSDPLYTQKDFQDSVIDRLDTPPSGVNDNRYLIGTSPTGDWSANANNITEYQDEWIFIAPSEGMMTWVEDEDVYYVYGGSSWVIFSSGGASVLDDLTDVVISGTPANNELLAYDTGGNWINQTASEAGLSATGHGHTASDVSDFDVEVGNHTDVTANTTHRGTVTGNPHSIDYTDAGAEQSFSKNTAFNLNFGTGTTDVPEIGTTLGNSGVVVTDSNGKLITETEQSGHNLVLGAGSGQVAEGDHSHTDLHVHSNKATLDLITSVGSGDIITSGERTGLHAHSNKTNLDVINQDLATSDRPSFDGIDPTTNNTYAIGSATERFLSLYLGTNLLIKNPDATNVYFRDLTDSSDLYLNAFNIKLTGLTASEIVETDGAKQLLSVTKGTAYNKAFGTGSGEVSEGNHSHSLPTYILLTSIPLFQEDLDAYIGGTSTGWINTGVAQRIIDWSTVYPDVTHYNCNYLMSSTHATSLARFRLKNVTQAAYVTTYGHVVSTLYNTYSTPISAIGSGTKMIAGDTYEIWYYVVSGATGKLNSLVLNLYKEVT